MNITSYPPILKPAMQQIEELQAEIARLRAQMDEVRSMLGFSVEAPCMSMPVNPEPVMSRPTPPVSVPEPKPEPKPEPQTVQSAPASVAETLYCTSLTFVDEEPVFPNNHISGDRFEAAYSLEVNGDKALFSLLPDQDAFEFLTGDLSKYIEAAAESDSEYDFDVVGLKTVQPGLAVRTAKGWKITQKAKISYIKE